MDCSICNRLTIIMRQYNGMRISVIFLAFVWISHLPDSINSYENKTWSSKSNSNLSKTFVLGSLKSLKFRSTPKILFIVIHFGSEQILGLKTFWFRKCFWSKKNFLSEIYFGFLLVVLVLPVTWVIQTPNLLNSAKSP